MGGHLACAFVATALSGILLTLVCLLRRDFGLIERAFSFSFFASAAIWVMPMLFDISARNREFMVYAFLALSIILLKVAFGKILNVSLLLWFAFLGGQALVFFMVYKQVF